MFKRNSQAEKKKNNFAQRERSKVTRERRPEPKEVKQTRADLLYGRNPVTEALVSGVEINKAWILKSDPSQGEKRDYRLSGIVNQLRERKIAIQYVDRVTLDRLTEKAPHQGVVLQVAAFKYADYHEVLKHKANPLILALDEIQEGYNLGSILRIADAAGVDLVIIPQHRAVGLDAHVAKASAGAIMHVPVARVTNLAHTLDELKKDGFWVFGTALNEKAQDYRDVGYKGKTIIAIGNEGKGLSKKILERCDFIVKIPMRGKINSLNAAVAAGIVVYEATNQRTADEALR